MMKDFIIRRATTNDIPTIRSLLYQVNQIHHEVRPDLFKSAAKKYTDEELEKILCDDQTPVFVAQTNDQVVGYAFCIHQQYINDNNMTDIKTLYIDDLCVDASMRGKHIGRALYEYVVAYAKQCGCYNVTLNVWADNKKALGFYQAIGLHVQKIGMETILFSDHNGTNEYHDSDRASHFSIRS